jgi:diketogulonate reductase-like aldo/keto reductase
MADDYHVVLSNGVVYPLVGYGTWLSNDESKLKTSLRTALDIGVRYIDTASLYQNEHIIGDVLQEYYDAGKLKREDLFIVTKLPSQGHHKEDVEYFINDSCKRLRTNYIDMYLIHNACAMKKNPDMTPKWIDHSLSDPDVVPHIETWRG